MKKLLILFTSFSIVPTPILVTACEAIESFPSKSFSTTTDVLELFFNDEINIIKPYNFEYLQLINNSWEHIGFESNLSTHKANNVLINLEEITEKEKEFVDILITLYEPIEISKNELDFSGLTFAIENIFLNSITLNDSYESSVQSEVAITIKSGWKTTGKLLLTLETSKDELIPKLETFGFINKLIESLGYKFKIEDSDETDLEFDFYISGNIDQQIFESFRKDLIKKQTILTGLKLTEDLITYKEETIKDENGQNIFQKSMDIDGVKYKFIKK